MSIQADLQKLAPSALVELFELDTSIIGGEGIDRFHAGVNGLGSDVVWNGQTYTRFPIEANGFAINGRGQNPRPTVTVSNINGLMGAVSSSLQDLLGAKFTRIRTFAKYLDAVNFEGGVNPDADPNAVIDVQVFYIDRKSNENKGFIEFELAAATDLVGVMLPRRQVIANVCPWKYRSPECSYTGGAVADGNDQPTTDLSVDKCGKRLASCRMRFGENAQLPFGGFPAVGLIQ
jgi:lambda family phage minor tail protein L